MVTYVAIPFQIKVLTGSYVAVGLIGTVEILPLIIFGLYGGVLADYVDRKKMVWAMEAANLLFVAILLINSFLPHPHLILIYVVTALFAATNGLQRPSADAILPRLVKHEDLPAASALMSLRWQVGVIVGPTVGGIIISTISISAGFVFDMATFLLSLYFLAKVRNIPSLRDAQKPSFKGLLEGISYAFSRKDLLGTYLIDLAAMFFAMPNALFPFWADEVHSPHSLGLFYAAGTIGSVLVTVTSGWIKRYRFHGRAIILAAIGWGIAIALSGLTHNIALILFCLALAGASDMVSALFRSAIWNQTIPDNLRGRLAGIELLSYSVGPLAGQMRAASVAAATSLTFSVTSGGIICVLMVLLLAGLLPTFRRYDVQTNEFAQSERLKREKTVD